LVARCEIRRRRGRGGARPIGRAGRGGGELANRTNRHYTAAMIIIRFPDAETERKALGKLAGRFAFKTWANGETMVPKMALSYLATENVAFTVVGPADYERLVPLRDPAAAAV
jgi:hypothetical protein